MQSAPSQRVSSGAGVALIAACLASACSASGEIPAVVLSQRGLVIPGTRSELGERSGTVQFSPPGTLELPVGVDVELFARSLSATAEAGVPDLSFVEALTLSMSVAGDGERPPRRLANYRRSRGERTGATLRVATDVDFNVLDYWSSDQAVYELTVSGRLPREAWALGLSITFEGSVSVGISERW